MLARKHDPDPHDDAQDETDHEGKARGVLKRPLAEVEDAGRLVLMHERIWRSDAVWQGPRAR